jgi:hypothetical protein
MEELKEEIIALIQDYRRDKDKARFYEEMKNLIKE